MPRITYGPMIDQQFPTVKWTGSSDVHRSVARYAGVSSYGRDYQRQLSMDIIIGGAAQRIWQGLRTEFQGMDWIVKGKEFENLITVDLIRHVYGEGDSYTKNKLKNPRTGNVFHQIAFKEETVCGIRVWAHAGDIGFRFRLEQKYEAEAETRARSAKAVLDYAQEIEKITEGLKMPALTTELVQQKSSMWLSLSQVKFKGSKPDYDEDEEDLGEDDLPTI